MSESGIFNDLAKAVAKEMIDKGAENFIGEVHTITLDDGGQQFELVVTAQKVGAKHPMDLCDEMREERDKAKAQAAAWKARAARRVDDIQVLCQRHNEELAGVEIKNSELKSQNKALCASLLELNNIERKRDALVVQFDALAAAVGYSRERLEQTGDSPLDCAVQLVAAYEKLKADDDRRYKLYIEAGMDKDHALALMADLPAVPMEALCTLLAALEGPPHLIRELQVTRGLPGSDNPIDLLVKSVHDWEKTHARVQDQPPA